MRKLLSTLFLLCLSIVSFAKEPQNLGVLRHEVIRYHNSGEYDKDMASIAKQAMRYLKMRLDNPLPNAKKPSIVLDIDETSLSNYPQLLKYNFGGSMDDIRQYMSQGDDSAITPTLKLFQFAKAHHVAVFFITSRPESQRDITIKNLHGVGFTDWDGLIMRTDEYKSVPSVATYKSAMRKQLIQQGYDILLNLGDQKSDLDGGYADKTFKLPDPYYFIP